MFAIKPPSKGRPSPAIQKPLKPAELRLIVFQATAIALASYTVSIVAFLVILVLLVCDILIAISLSRVALAGIMRAPIAALSGLAKQILINLNVRRPPEHFIDIDRAEAPNLWSMVEKLAKRMDVASPNRIVLEMSRNAWITLFGRTGRGRATLCLGLDILAFLSEPEIEAVIAHELAHAKLVQRGYKGWLTKSLIRTYQLAGALQKMNADAKRKRTKFYSALVLQRIVSALARKATGLVAAYQRQDEFLADAAAAEFCGADPFASALLSLRASRAKSVAWRDRVLQIQRGGSLLALLRDELAQSREEKEACLASAAQEPEERDVSENAFSTHPPFLARLAAIGADGRPSSACDQPASILLSDPEALAVRLIAHLERLALAQQRRESALLKKNVRKGQPRRKKYTAGEYLGSLFVVFGGLLLIPAIGGSFDPYRAAAIHDGLVYGGSSVGLMALGWAFLKLFALREKTVLPAPSFGAWEAALRERHTAITDRRNTVSAELSALLPANCRRRSRKARFWASEAYRALGECDFLRAQIAADFCLSSQCRHFEGLIARGIAAAYYQDTVTYNQSARVAYAERGLGPSTSWAVGWSLMMLDETPKAEGFLLDAIDRRPGDPSIWAMLAMCQAQLGKHQEAVQAVNEAILLSSNDPANRLLRARILLAKSDAIESEKELAALEPLAATNPDIAVALIHADLSLGNRERADSRAKSLLANCSEHRILLRLGDLYSQAKDPDTAWTYLSRARDVGFDAGVCLRLAGIASAKDDPENARALILESLDTTRLPAPGGLPANAAYGSALAGLLGIVTKVEGCKPWSAMAQLRVDPQSAGTTLIHLDIHAPSRDQADHYARELCLALCPTSLISEVWLEERAWKKGEPAAAEIAPGVISFKFQSPASAPLPKPGRPLRKQRD